MLRITIDITQRPASLILEGRLAGIWVSELERCWHTVGAACSGQSVCIDMRGLIFVDAAGKQLLAEMYGGGAELVASGCWMKSVVEDISRSEVRRPLASGPRQSKDRKKKR